MVVVPTRPAAPLGSGATTDLLRLPQCSVGSRSALHQGLSTFSRLQPEAVPKDERVTCGCGVALLDTTHTPPCRLSAHKLLPHAHHDGERREGRTFQQRGRYPKSMHKRGKHIEAAAGADT